MRILLTTCRCGAVVGPYFKGCNNESRILDLQFHPFYHTMGSTLFPITRIRNGIRYSTIIKWTVRDGIGMHINMLHKYIIFNLLILVLLRDHIAQKYYTRAFTESYNTDQGYRLDKQSLETYRLYYSTIYQTFWIYYYDLNNSDIM